MPDKVTPLVKMGKDVEQYLLEMPDELLAQLQFSVPWQYDEGTADYRDADGFALTIDRDDININREELQDECWRKFHRNPQLNTAVRGLAGRMCGLGFGSYCHIQQIQDAIDETELDPRNALYTFWPKYVVRSFIEGELFLCLTVHKDGFCEVDFHDPKTVRSSEMEEGIIYHPNKAHMPLVYSIDDDTHIPSIYIARYPELYNVARTQDGFDRSRMMASYSRSKKYAKMRGFYRFMIEWNKGQLTKRNVSHLRTSLEWLNHYENLKKYEIDHKKSAGSYLWVIEMEDVRAFKAWLALTDEQKRRTGIAAKKTPGSTIVLPPGMKLTAQNPQLPKISEQDTDILQMITSGLNEPEDVATGQARGTYASIRASRGPMSDRISDEVAYFERFLKYDFWASVFFLKSIVAGFPKTFNVKEAIDFKSQKPVFKNIPKRPEQLIEISFPTSEVIDVESRASGYLGVKHGSTYDVLGLPNVEISRKLGIHNYHKMRLLKATEEDRYPELLPPVDMESVQERREAEPARGTKTTPKPTRR